MWKLCFNVLLLRMMPDLETRGMIGLMSSKGLGLMTEIKMTPGGCCCLMFNESLLRQIAIITTKQS